MSSFERPTARRLIEWTDEAASDNFKKDGFVAPIYAAFLRDGTVTIALVADAFRNEQTKDRINQFLRMSSRKVFGPMHVGGVLVTEGWVAMLPRYARMLPLKDALDVMREIGPASKAPNRSEAILYMSEFRSPDGQIERAFGKRIIDDKTRELSPLDVEEYKDEHREEIDAAGCRQIGFGIL